MKRKWYPFQSECVAGVDVGYREGIYSVTKGVNGVNVIASGGCCGSIKERVSVDCFDAGV